MNGPAFWIVLVGAAVFLAAGCTNDGVNVAEEAGEIDSGGAGAPAETSSAGGADGVQAEVADQSSNQFVIDDVEADEAWEFYIAFLAQSDAYRVDPASELGVELTEVAAPRAAAIFDQQRAADVADPVFVATEVESIPNIVDFVWEDDRIVVTDCVERIERMETDERSGEISRFVDQVTEMVLVDDLLQIDAITIVHLGGSGAPGLGCVPPLDAERAAAGALGFAKAFTAAQREPAAGVSPDLSEQVVGRAGPDVAESLSELAAQGLAIAAPGITFETTVLGRDGTLVGPNAVVGVCLTLPEGMSAVSLSTGEFTRELFSPGTTVMSELEMLLIDDGWKTSHIRSGFRPEECAS